MKKPLGIGLLILSLSVPLVALAHQPRVVNTNQIFVEEPEISKAYYGTLVGEPHVYTIYASSTFELYVNILVPDEAGARTDMTAAVIDTQTPNEPLVVLGGSDAPWKKYFEEFARDAYLRGPEFKKQVPAGTYQIRVWNSNNMGKYVLATGDIEQFKSDDILHAVQVLPQIKQEYFNKSPLTALATPFIGGPILLLLVILGVGAYPALLYYRRRKAGL